MTLLRHEETNNRVKYPNTTKPTKYFYLEDIKNSRVAWVA